MMGLTHRQAEALAFIRDRIASKGIAPSFDEIVAGIGLKSKSEVSRLVEALVERGALRRLPGRARALALTGEHGRLADARLSQLASRRGVSRDSLIHQAVDEFLERELRA